MGIRDFSDRAGAAGRRGVIAAVVAACLQAQAGAQAPPSPLNDPSLIPSAVRPGVIEAQMEVRIAPGFGDAPAVLSPYEPEQPAGAADIVFRLADIVLDGAATIAPSALRAEFEKRIGAEVRLGEIFEIARAITRRYAEAGYPLSLAYVPVQDIENGIVRIRIIEGFVGEIDVAGVDGAQRKKLLALGARIMAERPLSQKALERYLLIANQIPGVKVSGVLDRAASPEQGVKLTFKAAPKKFGLSAAVNNRASRAVGREQIVAGVNVADLVTGADAFTFAAVQSVKIDELTYFAAGYSTMLNAEGLVAGIRATRSEASPGVPLLRDLGFETQGWTAAADLSYPLILRRNTKLSLSGRASWKEFRSAFGVSPNTHDVLWTTSLGAALAVSDRFGGDTSLAVGMTKGWDAFDATQAGSLVASRQGAGAEFLAFTLDLGRVQKLTDVFSLAAAIKGQATSKPLLSSEQCGYGGGGIGRGYDPYEIAGDQCIVGLVELRAAPAFLSRGQFKMQPYISIDAGAVRQNGSLAVGEERTASLYSAALGARVGLTKYLSANFEGGLPLKGVVKQQGDDDPRFFFSLEARY